MSLHFTQGFLTTRSVYHKISSQHASGIPQDTTPGYYRIQRHDTPQDTTRYNSRIPPRYHRIPPRDAPRIPPQDTTPEYPQTTASRYPQNTTPAYSQDTPPRYPQDTTPRYPRIPQDTTPAQSRDATPEDHNIHLLWTGPSTLWTAPSLTLARRLGKQAAPHIDTRMLFRAQ